MILVGVAFPTFRHGALAQGLDLTVREPGSTLLAPRWRRRLRSYRTSGSRSFSGGMGCPDIDPQRSRHGRRALEPRLRGCSDSCSSRHSNRGTSFIRPRVEADEVGANAAVVLFELGESQAVSIPNFVGAIVVTLQKCYGVVDGTIR